LFLSSVAMVLVLMVFTVSAASTVFTDEADADFSKVKEKVGTWQFEDNQDVEKTLYSKGAGALMDEISLIYEVNGPISAFKVDTLNCSGIGDSTLDVGAYVSADGSSWTAVETSVTDQVMDDAYISPDIAYWFNSSVSNKNAIPAGMKYLKVSLLPFDRQGMVNWATVIDEISITYEGTKPTPSPTTAPTVAPTSPPASLDEISEAAPSEIESEEESLAEDVSEPGSGEESEEKSAEVSEPAGESQTSDSGTSEADVHGKNKAPLLIGGIVLVVIIAGVLVLFLTKQNKNKTDI
jgi:hypothetical protein